MKTNGLKSAIPDIAVVVAFVVYLTGCDFTTTSNVTVPSWETTAKTFAKSSQPLPLKRLEVRNYLGTIVTRLTNLPEAANAALLNQLQKGPVSLNKVSGLENANSQVVVDETGNKYEVVLSLFKGSTFSDPPGPPYFAVDPDRFVEPGNNNLMAYKNPRLGSGITVITLEGLTAKTTVPYPLVFVDIQESIAPERHLAILNELIRGSKIYKEYGIMEVPCEDCGGGGGGGGGWGRYCLVSCSDRNSVEIRS